MATGRIDGLVRIDGEDSETEIFTAQQNLEEAQKKLEAAQKNLDNCNAVAPISGQVIGLSVTPEEDLPKVFERFYRVDKSHSKAVGGTGLGLSIVKHGAALHHATISVSSEPEQGTEITLTFPAA